MKIYLKLIKVINIDLYFKILFYINIKNKKSIIKIFVWNVL